MAKTTSIRMLMRRNKTAFSLVELSIVLVILGLLVGGILAGQSLIRASELRAVGAEHNRFFTATMTFRDKYFALPGDMRNATTFWQRRSTSSWCNTNSAATVNTRGTCDGDGDGLLSAANSSNQSQEIFEFWSQLALAGVIEGNYSGLAGNSSAHSQINTNIPSSKMSGGGWGVIARDTMTNSYFWSPTVLSYGNTLYHGAETTNGGNYAPILRPEEAWNIDTKLDDGMPGKGKIVVVYWDECTDGVSRSAINSTYLLNSPDIACSLTFRQQF